MCRKKFSNIISSTFEQGQLTFHLLSKWQNREMTNSTQFIRRKNFFLSLKKKPSFRDIEGSQNSRHIRRQRSLLHLSKLHIAINEIVLDDLRANGKIAFAFCTHTHRVTDTQWVTPQDDLGWFSVPWHHYSLLSSTNAPASPTATTATFCLISVSLLYCVFPLNNYRYIPQGQKKIKISKNQFL